MDKPSRAKDIFAHAHDLSGSTRDAYLAEACGDDAELRLEVQRLLVKSEQVDSFFADDGGATIGAEDFEPALTEAEGDEIGPYTLRQQIGEGGFGTVWMAEQTGAISRMVALKVVKAGMDTKQVLSRFEAERQAVAMMDHPNIAKVLDAGATPTGRPYFVMELVKGVPITRFCDQQKFGPRLRLELFKDVCAAVNHAHQKGIIHRDLKPSNIMVTLAADVPVVKVIDFGIAKATHSKLTEKTLFTRFEQFLGTPVYMSPEQAAMSAIDVDTRSDIYSLGVLLYELLAGAPPFDQKSLLSAGYDEMRRIIAEDEPPKPSTRCTQTQAGTRTATDTATGSTPKRFHVNATALKGDLDWIVMKAIEKDRTRRYETANAFAADIGRFLEDEPVLAAAPSAAYKFKKFARRNKTAFAVSAAMVLLLLGGITVSSWQAIVARRAEKAESVQRDLAEERRETAEAERSRANAEAARAREAETAARHEQGVAWVERADALFKEKRFSAGKLLAARTIGFAGFGGEAVGNQNAALVRPLLAGESDESATVRERLVAQPDYAPVFRSPLSVAVGRLAGANWSADGTRIVVGTNSGDIQVWDVDTGRRLHAFRAHDRRLMFLALTPDGKSAVSTSLEGATFRRHDLETGEELWSVSVGSHFYGGAISPRGRIAIACTSRAIVRVNVATGEQLPTLQASSRAYGLAFHPSKPLLASGHSNGELRLWNRDTGELIQRVIAYRKSTYSVAFSPEGDRLLTSGEDTDNDLQGVKIWSLGKEDRLTMESEWSGFESSGSALPRHLRRLRIYPRPQNDFAVVFAPDGSLQLRSLPDGAPLGTLDEPRPGNRVLKISPDGSRLVSVWLGTLRLWDLEQRREITHHGGGEVDLAHGVDFSPDGRLLATASADGQVRLRDLSSGKVVLRRAMGGDVETLRFSPDGRRIAVRTRRHKPPVWILDSASLEQVAELSLDYVQSLAWSPGGEWLATAASDGVQLWDTTNFELAAKIDTEARALSFTPDGKMLVCLSSNGTTLWDVATQQQHSEWEEVASFAYASITFHPDGDLFATSGSGGTVKLWSFGNPPTELGSMKLPGTNNSHAIRFSPDGTLLAAAGKAGIGGTHKSVHLWDVRTQKLLATLEGHSREIRDVRFAPDGQSIATTSEDNTVRIWEIDRPLERESIDIGEIDHREAKFVDRDTLVSLGSSGIHLIDRRRGAVLRKLSSRIFAGSHLTVSPDGRYVLAGGQRGALLLEIETGHELASFENQSYVFTSSAFSADGRWLAVSRGTWLDLFDLETRQTTSWPRQFNMTAVGFDPAGRLYAADDDGMIRVLDVARREVSASFRASDGELGQMLLAQDGKTLATAGRDYVVRIWNLPSHDLRHELDVPSQRWVKVAITPDGGELATLSDGEVRLWSATTGKELHRYRNTGLDEQFRPYSLDFSPDGEFIAADGAGSAIALYPASPHALQPDRIADYLTDLRLDGHQVVPREGNLLTARPAFWSPRLPTTHLALLGRGGSAEETDRNLVRHYLASGNLDSAALVLRRLPALRHAAEVRAVLEALGRRVDRLGRRGLTEVALRYSDLALDLAPLSSDAAVFGAERDRAEALFLGDRHEDALALYSGSIERALKAGFGSHAELLAASRLRVVLQGGDLASSREQFAALLALPGFSDDDRRAIAIRRYLDDTGRVLLKKHAEGETNTDEMLALALAKGWIASESQPAVDFSRIEPLSPLVAKAREDREPLPLVAKESEWHYWDTSKGAPPAGWKDPGFDPSAWSTGAGPLSFSDTADAPDRRNESLVQYARLTFVVDADSLPADFSLALTESCRPAAAFFLNGPEILRQRLHPGELGPETPSLKRVLGHRREVASATLAEPLRDGQNVLAVQLHRPAPDNSLVGLEVELIATVTPGAYLAAATGRLGEIVDASYRFLPPELQEELMNPLRFAYPARIDAAFEDGWEPEDWRRRARVQRSLGRRNEALSALRTAQKLASESGNFALEGELALDLSNLQQALEAGGGGGLRPSQPVAAVLVAPDAEWKWLHPLDGVDPAEGDPDFHQTFHAADYDDASWKTGKDSEGATGGFGYGEDGFEGVDIGTPEAGVRYSAYLRHAFTTAKVHTNLELHCQRADGIIVYLDGVELGRDNMDKGEEAYYLAAALPVRGDDEKTVFAISLEGELPAGEHVLAISLHNTNPTSSDLRIGGITLVEVEEAKLPLLTGRWVDRNGGEIKIEQTGAEAIATGQNEKATEWWTKGVGKLEGNRITMTHFKGDSQTDVQTGTISADGSLIDWANGTYWKRIEDEAGEKPDANPDQDVAE